MNNSIQNLTCPAAEKLVQKIATKKAHLGVVGLGYVGLPLAVEMARKGYQVTGIDVSPEKIQRLQQGDSYVGDIPSATLAEVVKSGLLRTTTDFSVLADLDTVNICVPTPLRKTGDPDVSYIVSAVKEIAPRLHRGQLVILESTTYPGTTEELILPRLEETGLKVGQDFFLAFSPERVDPGNAQWTTRNIPKVVGGVTPVCTQVAECLYKNVLNIVVTVDSTRVAEMVKLLENTFRSVNIGLVNEMALMCDRMGINVWEVIDAAATKPFGFMPFYPGPGLGGHCIPIDPFYLSWKAKLAGFEARFIELAGHVNSHMPIHVVARVTQALNSIEKSVNGSRLLLLGIAYKADIDDIRESPSLDILALLREQGAHVVYHDPYVPELFIEGEREESCSLTPELLEAMDCVIITTAHKKVDHNLVADKARLVVDTRNALKNRKGRHIYRL
ncbi:MAG: nucleotide sugar dehydrogenase [Candidatus Eisenbacteria bacterium]|uniref:Nucleotide sugar dehydrogenase n=1 Tax=Eiseniibacteriota bacterium TaxID=2212470 RepID=A0A948RYW3_UNCEI|nr:nucleotide sugar dehydrogenase [Candidatus Eisenbacteria bacterium]MBU1947521.1 nucleotide sugar dehydrogenase [Candidatus Eisenbacteria bacterium]MBU2691677.1 nucleotide sugar dehydrogenase [Candidatus Eisenbacteria bacterium]